MSELFSAARISTIGLAVWHNTSVWRTNGQNCYTSRMSLCLASHADAR